MQEQRPQQFMPLELLQACVHISIGMWEVHMMHDFV
jgi:hypothetical protein